MKDLVIDTEIRGLPIESPLVYARQLAQAELRSEITAQERGWLTNHPLLWLRALRGLRSETHDAIQRDREKFKAEWPQTRRIESAFHVAQAKQASLNARRLHFLKNASQRIGELSVVLGGDLASAPLIGEVVEMLLDIVELIDKGEVQGARRAAKRRAQHLVRVYGMADPPDNSEAAPIGMILPKPGWGGHFYCRGCHGVALDDVTPVCSRCKQRHDVSFDRP
jgi:hypothetical protein